MQGAMERIEYEAQVLECHDAEQGLGVVRVAEYDWRVTVSLGEREMALGDRPGDRCAISQGESLFSSGGESDAFPDRMREQ